MSPAIVAARHVEEVELLEESVTCSLDPMSAIIGMTRSVIFSERFIDQGIWVKSIGYRALPALPASD